MNHSKANSERDNLAPFPVSDERRATLQALNAWLAARGDDDVPSLASLFDGRRAFLGNEFLIKVDPETQDSIFIVCGGGLPLPLGARSVGKPVRGAVPSHLRHLFCDASAEAVQRRVAVSRTGALYLESRADIRYRSIFLPVHSDDEHDHMYVFGAFGSTANDGVRQAVA